jgi:hemerythrin-like domain-containing protein
MESDASIAGPFDIRDPFLYLAQEHRKVEELFGKLEEEEEGAESRKQDLFDELSQALSLHAELEETYLYPLLEEREETQALSEEGQAEHAEVKELLAELEQLSVSEDEWGAKLSELQEKVSHHVMEEENEMFEKARQVLTESEIATLAQSMAAFVQETE